MWRRTNNQRENWFWTETTLKCRFRAKCLVLLQCRRIAFVSRITLVATRGLTGSTLAPSGGRRADGASALGRAARASSIARRAAGRCSRPASTRPSTTRCACHTTCTSRPIGRPARARAADLSGRCPSGPR